MHVSLFANQRATARKKWASGGRDSSVGIFCLHFPREINVEEMGRNQDPIHWSIDLQFRSNKLSPRYSHGGWTYAAKVVVHSTQSAKWIVFFLMPSALLGYTLQAFQNNCTTALQL